jgi:hypothetical protein
MKFMIACAFVISLASCGSLHHNDDNYWAGVTVGMKNVEER